MYVHLYVKNGYKIVCPKLCMLVSWNQYEILEGSKLRISDLGLSPSEGGFCSSETRHNRETAPRSESIYYVSNFLSSKYQLSVRNQ